MCYIYSLSQQGYDVKNIYNQVKELYNGECIIPLNKRNTKNPKLLPQGHPICEAGLAMWKDGKFSDRGRTRQKFCCPLKSSKDTVCPCHHKNFYNGKKHRGCTKYLTLPDDLRLSIDRDSKYFKSNYSPVSYTHLDVYKRQGELWGIADRTDYDLTQHQEVSKQDMTYFDDEKKEKYIPYVIEPSLDVYKRQRQRDALMKMHHRK